MKEFVEKLIERLEEYKTKAYVTGITNDAYEFGACSGMDSAIKIVNKLAEEYEPCIKSCTDCEAYDLVKHNCPKFCKVIKETVEEVKENYSNGWIPCSERLPNKEDMIKSYCRNKYGSEFIVMIDGATRPTTLYRTMDGFWVDDHRCVYKVIAWQPLPQPYKEGSENNA